ncbi:probable yellowish-green 1 protein [Rhynchosporium graminicola]|uniref:Probable yellowish-green 1 protein n=1 Tax=Rhynchosporium graminicola TaxID=2792576 RepID=A0A1E1LTG2_9HELO|nr:probable yellowish-green 1 protein [Rhynchosporium commune]
MMGLWNGLGLGKSSFFGAQKNEQAEKPRLWQMGDAFEKKMPHHEGIKQLWETKWKFPCSINVYPFHDGKMEDFEPVFLDLIKRNINDGTSPEYTRAFFPTAAKLITQADAEPNPKLSSDLYLRAACLYRIARFPYITSFPFVNDSTKWEAWTLQKKVYLKAASKWEVPMTEIMIPHVQKSDEDRPDIPAYVRVSISTDEAKSPAVILMTGLDGYRPDNTARSEEFLSRGWASVIVEIPGTADCPADPKDPAGSERLWSSVLDWMEKDGRFDMQKIIAWGLSSGGYHAVRIAHTHRERLRGVVAQGAGVHYFFDRDWIEKADGHEYPFKLSPAMALKHGYKTVEEYKNGAQKKFSLLESGLLDKPSTRLILINGTRDGLMPIEDSMLLFEHGTPKEARFFDKALHMGYPMANSAVYPWMESVMA